MDIKIYLEISEEVVKITWKNVVMVKLPELTLVRVVL